MLNAGHSVLDMYVLHSTYIPPRDDDDGHGTLTSAKLQLLTAALQTLPMFRHHSSVHHWPLLAASEQLHIL